jgi:hypothetical protein
MAGEEARLMSSRHVHPALIRGGVVAVGAATLAVSAYFQYQLGLLAGSTVVALTLPVALDAGGFVASACWLIGRGSLRAWGCFVTVLLVASSTAVNVVAHGLISGWDWAPLGLVYPLVFAAMVKLELLHQEQRAELADALDELGDARSVRAAAEAEATAHAAEIARLRAAADADRDAAQQAERDAADARRRAEDATRQIPASAARQPARRGKSRKSTAEQRQAWITGQLDAGRDVAGSDVKREFPDAANGARDVATVKARRAQEKPALSLAK